MGDRAAPQPGAYCASGHAAVLARDGLGFHLSAVDLPFLGLFGREKGVCFSETVVDIPSFFGFRKKSGKGKAAMEKSFPSRQVDEWEKGR